MAPGTLQFDYSQARSFLAPEGISNQEEAVGKAHAMLHGRSGPGSEYSGWLDLPHTYDRSEFARIKEAAARIRDQADALVVIGIGGSYLGARAAIEALRHSFYNYLPHERRGSPQIFFAGQNVSPVYLRHLLEVLEGREIAVNVISKSGTTTEPAIAFRLFRELLERRYGKDGARQRIYATTDRSRGALNQLATEEGYERFVIPDEVGGRFSVLTAVGLLPIAVSGADIDQLMAGAAAGVEAYGAPHLADNLAYQYAAARNELHALGKEIEMLVSYEPALSATTEWWKQLYGESEGKDLKGLFPAAASFTTDLHSLGQYIQDGQRLLFETVLQVAHPAVDLTLEAAPGDGDGLNFLTGKSLDFVNRQAFAGTLLAHVDGGVPNLVITLPQLSEFHYGQMLYFFEKACGISGYMLGVNPFDQPGVEAYKRNMFALLGRPGYEEERIRLEGRLG
jgi:glucose-6-phosphate isomerase